MTELQLGLIGLGGVAVLGVVVYNKWQESRHRKLAEKVLGAPQPDVLFEAVGSRGDAAAAQAEAPYAVREAVALSSEVYDGYDVPAAPAFSATSEESKAPAPHRDHEPAVSASAEARERTASFGERFGAQLAGRFGFSRKAEREPRNLNTDHASETASPLATSAVSGERIEPALPGDDFSASGQRREPALPDYSSGDEYATNDLADAVAASEQSARSNQNTSAKGGVAGEQAAMSAHRFPQATAAAGAQGVSQFLMRESGSAAMNGPVNGPVQWQAASGHYGSNGTPTALDDGRGEASRPPAALEHDRGAGTEFVPGGAETSAGGRQSASTTENQSAGPRISQETSAAPQAEVRHDTRREAPSGAMLLSPLIDYVASFEAVEPATAQQIFGQPVAALARLRTPVSRVGYNELVHEWEPIHDDGAGEYRRFRIGLQLVDRQGPVSDAELAFFHGAMQGLADATLAIVDLPPRPQALATAVELDAFCAGVDIQIGINVISQAQIFPGTKLRALAEAAGMIMDVEGRFVRCDEDGNVLYVLVNQDAQPFAPETMKTLTTRGLTFLLDVPRVAHGDRVFNQMVDLAKRFAEVLRGVVVDDNQRPLSESSLEPIRKQIVHYQTLLSTHHLPAGSAVTRRLFS